MLKTKRNLFPVGKIAEKAECIFDNLALYFECRIN